MAAYIGPTPIKQLSLFIPVFVDVSHHTLSSESAPTGFKVTKGQRKSDVKHIISGWFTCCPSLNSSPFQLLTLILNFTTQDNVCGTKPWDFAINTLHLQSHVMAEKAFYSVFTCVLSDSISRAEVCRIGMLSAFISDIHGYSVRLMWQPLWCYPELCPSFFVGSGNSICISRLVQPWKWSTKTL